MSLIAKTFAPDCVFGMDRYRKAAEQGVPDAQTNLGELCANGDGIPKDDVEAVKWFRKAAEQGDARAQFDLGRLYEAGRGISRNTVEAYAWFSLSTAAGNGEAPSRLSDLAKRMTPAQMAEGKRRADAWLAQHQRR
jgi:TPR repeat protein